MTWWIYTSRVSYAILVPTLESATRGIWIGRRDQVPDVQQRGVITSGRHVQGGGGDATTTRTDPSRSRNDSGTRVPERVRRRGSCRSTARCSARGEPILALGPRRIPADDAPASLSTTSAGAEPLRQDRNGAAEASLRTPLRPEPGRPGSGPAAEHVQGRGWTVAAAAAATIVLVVQGCSRDPGHPASIDENRQGLQRFPLVSFSFFLLLLPAGGRASPPPLLGSTGRAVGSTAEEDAYDHRLCASGEVATLGSSIPVPSHPPAGPWNTTRGARFEPELHMLRPRGWAACLRPGSVGSDGPATHRTSSEDRRRLPRADDRPKNK
jgi:hypothetical protein